LEFAPLVRNDNHETVLLHDLQHRLALNMVGPDASMSDEVGYDTLDGRRWSFACSRAQWLVSIALARGELRAFLMPEAESRYYRIPAGYWTGESMDREPHQTLFCFNNSGVENRFHDRPLLFFLDEVERWEYGLAPFLWDDRYEALWVQRDLDEQPRARMGYWSTFETLAWVATRDLTFVGAVPSYLKREKADRGGDHSCAAMLSLGTAAAKVSGVTFSAACDPLSENLESGTGIIGVTAINEAGERLEIGRHQWVDWCLHYPRSNTVSLLRGWYDFRWPSDAVIAAFPADAENLQDEASVARKLLSDEEILARCDELWLSGLNSREIEKVVPKEERYKGTKANYLRELLRGRFPRLGRSGVRTREMINAQ